MLPGAAKPLLRADSAFYGHPTVSAAIRAGADVSVTVRLDQRVKATIATIDDDARQTIQYTDAVFDETTNTLDLTRRGRRDRLHRVHVEEEARPDPRPARRTSLPDLNPKARRRQATLFDTWRFHAFFTTSTLDTVTADKTHRGHAIIEQVNADPKNSAPARLPSGTFCAHAAWLVLACIAFNLSRAAATLTGPSLAKATTATIRRKLISVPARIATSARRPTLHLPTGWPWETEWTELFTRICGPPGPTST